jgi:hypothetical protein
MHWVEAAAKSSGKIAYRTELYHGGVKRIFRWPNGEAFESTPTTYRKLNAEKVEGYNDWEPWEDSDVR